MIIATIIRVIRSEGPASALRRASERMSEAARDSMWRARGLFAGAAHTAIVNVSAGGIAQRSGGVAVQLMARMHEERALRDIALLHPGGLMFTSPFPHTKRMGRFDFEASIGDALSITGANAVHIEGTHGVPVDAALRLIDSGRRVVVSVHDFSLASENLARTLLESAAGVIFPSPFLLEKHRELLGAQQMNAEVIEPPSPAERGQSKGVPNGIAFAGGVKRHKGAHLLPEIAAMLAGRGLDLHIFGGGDADLFRALRRHRNVVIHGYYRSDTLPSLLDRHGIGLVVLPSIVPEAFSLTLSEAWLAGAQVVAFDIGAPADRIRRNGGGWLAPLESGAEGLIEIVERWITDKPTMQTPRITTPAEAARAHVDLYRRWSLLPRQ